MQITPKYLIVDKSHHKTEFGGTRAQEVDSNFDVDALFQEAYN